MISAEDRHRLTALAGQFLARHDDRVRDELVAWLASLDVSGFELDAMFARIEDRTAWTIVDLARTPQFGAFLFLLPAGVHISVHDHPGMHVFMRVVHGEGRVRAWDWVERPTLARFGADEPLASDQPVRVTAPIQGNLHALDATTDLAFIDVLVPPYNRDVGRVCTWYHVGDPDASGVCPVRIDAEE